MATTRRPKRARPYLWSTIAALAAVVWIGSYWITAYVGCNSRSGWRCGSIRAGTIRYVGLTGKGGAQSFTRGWHAEWVWVLEQNRFWLWWPGCMDHPVNWLRSRTLWIPLWPLVAAAAGFAGIHWRRARRLPPNACPNCGYPRAGLAEQAPCPECGRNAQQGGASR
jgi:hypothetical protein